MGPRDTVESHQAITAAFKLFGLTRERIVRAALVSYDATVEQAALRWARPLLRYPGAGQTRESVLTQGGDPSSGHPAVSTTCDMGRTWTRQSTPNDNHRRLGRLGDCRADRSKKHAGEAASTMTAHDDELGVA